MEGKGSMRNGKGMNADGVRLLVAGMALFGVASAFAVPGPMQVEEPALDAPKPPIQPERDQESWTARSSGLTDDQREALKARQERMDDMVALIRQKRRAIKEARPQDREALAQELHNLILEKSQGGQRTAERDESRLDSSKDPVAWHAEIPDMGLNARMKEKAQSQADIKIKLMEYKEEILRQQEARRKLLEQKLKQMENKGNGNGDGPPE